MRNIFQSYKLLKLEEIEKISVEQIQQLNATELENFCLVLGEEVRRVRSQAANKNLKFKNRKICGDPDLENQRRIKGHLLEMLCSEKGRRKNEALIQGKPVLNRKNLQQLEYQKICHDALMEALTELAPDGIKKQIVERAREIRVSKKAKCKEIH